MWLNGPIARVTARTETFAALGNNGSAIGSCVRRIGLRQKTGSKVKVLPTTADSADYLAAPELQEIICCK